MSGFRRVSFGVVLAFALVVGVLIPASVRSEGEMPVGYLKVHTSPAVPTIVTVNGIPMDGWGVDKVPLAPGDYSVSFTDVLGFTTPEPIAASILEGETTTIQGNFVELGMLRVVSDPAVKTTISVDGIPRDDYGLWLYVEPGRHTVSFGPVEGYDPPADSVVRVNAGKTTVVTGTFTANPSAPGPGGKGMLRVETSPALPTTVSVNGIPRDSWGLGWLTLEPGTYEVSFSDVRDYATPEPQVVEVVAGEVTAVMGEFELLGGLRAVTSPPQSAVIYINDVPRDAWGVWLTLPEGSYTVSFGEIPGHPPLASKTVLVVPGQTVLVVGEY